MRLTFEPAEEVYKVLEPLLGDYRKLRRRTRDGAQALTFMDQFVDDLLTKDRVCATILPRLTQRTILEDDGKLEERESPLGAELDEIDEDSDRGSVVEVNGNGRHHENSEGSG